MRRRFGRGRSASLRVHEIAGRNRDDRHRPLRQPAFDRAVPVMRAIARSRA